MSSATPSLGSPSTSHHRFQIRPIISESDVPALARLADVALQPDAFHEFRSRYGSQSVYDETAEKLTASLRDTPSSIRRYFLFKAVLIPDLNDGSDDQERSDTNATDDCTAGEVIIGFSQWRIGYVETPKMDPFAPRNEASANQSFEVGVSNVVVSEGSEPGKATGTQTTGTAEESAAGKGDGTNAQNPFYSNPDAELHRKLMNSYISSVRGKRHLCKSSPGQLTHLTRFRKIQHISHFS